jgi:nucleoside-diphosphate-sugar epimerase
MREPPSKTDGFATYLHATDAALAYAAALEHPRPGFEAYHFSAAEIASLHPLRDRLRAHHPDYPPLPEDWPAFKSPLLLNKAREHFGWEPAWNALDFYRQHHGEPSLPPMD